jgi:deoxycytidine triphosphate deaminase
MLMQANRGLKMVAKRAYDQKVKRLASLYARNTKTLIVVDGKIEGVPVTQIIAALDSDIQYVQKENRLYLARV